MQATEPSPDNDGRLISKKRLKPRQLHFSPAKQDLDDEHIEQDGSAAGGTAPEQRQAAGAADEQDVPVLLFSEFVDELNTWLSQHSSS